MTRRNQIHSMAAMLLAGCTISATHAVAEPGWLESRLLAPSAAQQRMERQDRVYIYDGLDEETVDHALDTQFGRIQHMMFVGVRHTDPDGSEWVDDDCD